MPPALNPEALQMVLPAVQRLMARMGPKSEQPIQQMAAMMRMAEPATLQPAPWSRLMKMLPSKPPVPGMVLERSGGRGAGLEFALEPPGMKRSLGGRLTPGAAPDEAHVQYLGSLDSPRLAIGGPTGAMENYSMDISSPAQRELPLRGMRLPAAEKAARPARELELRQPGWSQAPPIPLAQKQQAFDAMARLLRGAGFKKLSFEAEAGERPRLYQALTGYKPEPQGQTRIEDLLERMPGRLPRHVTGGHPGGLPAYGSQRTQWAGGLSTQTPLDANTLETALSVAAEDAVQNGLAVKAGTGYRLTPAGVLDVQDALRQMGIQR